MDDRLKSIIAQYKAREGEHVKQALTPSNSDKFKNITDKFNKFNDRLKKNPSDKSQDRKLDDYEISPGLYEGKPGDEPFEESVKRSKLQAIYKLITKIRVQKGVMDIFLKESAVITEGELKAIMNSPLDLKLIDIYKTPYIRFYVKDDTFWH